MRQAIELGRAQLGKTAPNPPVGCVIVKDGEVICADATGDGGRPHAEEAALERVGEKARDAVVYVTLEPCHTRSSGALGCSDRLINAGVKRVVASLADPHPTAMDGFAKLRAAGVQVDVGLLADDAAILVEGFFHHLDTGRPLVVIDSDVRFYDAAFELGPDESPEGALTRLGGEGVTRICVKPGSVTAAALHARNLIDRVAASDAS